MQTIAHLISALILSLNSVAVSPAPADLRQAEDICGKGTISAGSDCELLNGDACAAACNATDWSRHCSDQCCVAGADYGEYGECDPNCVSACEYNSWGDCTYNWCGSSNVLFCDGQPKATNGELDACLDYLCKSDVDVIGLVCEPPVQAERKSPKAKR